MTMPLLKNADIRIHPKCRRDTIVWAAIQGPWRKEFDMDTILSVLLGVAIVASIVTVCFDITIWRP